MAVSVSIIIPNRNGEATIGKCLEAAFTSGYKDFEVIVVDDFSVDHSVDVIKRFPCKLLQLAKHSGASRARNVGANHSNGDILFFTDADCLLNEDTLTIAIETLSTVGPNVLLGGTYTTRPFDDTFFSRFQSVFITYSETRNTANPDYVATHAMIINAHDFEKSGGFAEGFLPILEDVEFSHKMQRKGYRLLLNPVIQVRHIFGYSLAESMQNAFRKSMFWTIYSIHNKDLLANSGTASRALKLNVATLFFATLVILLIMITGDKGLSFIVLLLIAINLVANYGLLRAFYEVGGARFSLAASVYYLLLYPLAVGAGGLAGIVNYSHYAKRLKGAG